MNMSDEVLKRREIISALVDGQLRGDEFAPAVHAAAHDADAQATWDAYHLVGDVLRNGALGAPVRDQAFVTRLSARLQQEPVAQRPQAVAEPLSQAGMRTAANAPSFRWKMVAGFASLAAIAAIGWNVLGSFNAATGQPQLALAPASTAPSSVAAPSAAMSPTTAPVAMAVNEAPPVMMRDPRLDELLAAHKQFGGTSALQMPAGFLRNATFEGGGR